MPICSMPRAPSMQLVEHMEAAAAIVLMPFPCKKDVLYAAGNAESAGTMSSLHFSISRATQNQVWKGWRKFLGVCRSRTTISDGESFNHKSRESFNHPIPDCESTGTSILIHVVS